MKPFDLEAAKRGDPIINRSGDKCRILCFDLHNNTYCLVVAHMEDGHFERVLTHVIDGKYKVSSENDFRDLFMAPKKIKLKNVLLKNKDGQYFVPSNAFYKDDGHLFIM